MLRITNARLFLLPCHSSILKSEALDASEPENDLAEKALAM